MNELIIAEKHFMNMQNTTACDIFGHSYSDLSMLNLWLQAAGFDHGDKVVVLVEERKLIITKADVME